ncbi:MULTISPECIES: EAL domain-containing protein [unclassified Roseitalea]|nr:MULTISPECIES: EAL domain-containing protein [unclassified Roseitalea]
MSALDTLDFLREGIYWTSLDGKLIHANRALVELNGYETLAELRAVVSDIANEWYVDADRRAQFMRALADAGQVRDFVSMVRRYRTGECIWVTEDARLVLDPLTGKPSHYEGSVRDITAIVRGQENERQFAKLVNQVPGGLFQLARHADGRYALVFASPGFHALLGYRRADDLGALLGAAVPIHPDDRDRYMRSLAVSAETLTDWGAEFRILRADGSERWLSLCATPERADGSIVWSGYCSDISERKANELEIRQLALFDPLTGLANRRHLINALAKSMERHRREGTWAGLICIDLDHFKQLNDTHGHGIGDQMLVEAGKRMTAITWVIDLVARVDGDEFVIVCEDLGAEWPAVRERLEAIVAKLQGALRQSVQIDKVDHLATGSMGVVAFDGSEGDPQEILRRGNAAMHAAKRRGRNTHVFFDPDTGRRGGRDYALLRDMLAAMDDGTLDFHLQPQVDRHGAVHGCEALMRWTHPDHGFVRPSEFFPMIENSPSMTLFTQGAVCRAMACLRDWKGHAVLGRLTFSLNITPHSLTQELAFAQLCDVVRANADIAGRLVLEITEHVLAQDKALVRHNMGVLRALGVQFSIDDFGTGFSSLAYLKNLTFDELKIDGSFITDMEASSSDRALVRTILAVAQTLDMRAIAERVETEEQRALLTAYGCTLMQGHLFRPAMVRSEFEAYAVDHPPPGERSPISASA